MPLIDRDAERNLAEKETQDLIRGRGLASRNEIDSSAAVTAGSRGRFASSIPNLAASLASRTGTADSGAGPAAVAPFVEDLKRTDQEANSLRLVREKRDNVNKLFSFMSDRLQQAGVDRTQAEQVARQFALDEDQRANITANNERERNLTVQKQDMLDTYTDKKIQMQRDAQAAQAKDAIKQSIYKSLAGLAGAVVGGFIGGPMGAMAGAGAASSLVTNKNVQSDTPLTTRSSFSTNIDPNTGKRI